MSYNLECIPRVLHYFVKFLLRSKYFPQIEDQLSRCLDVIKLAIIELPNTLNIGKTFPDKFSRACNVCWGKKADGYTLEPVEDNTLKERQAKRQKCDTDIPRAETTAKWASGSVDDWGAAAVLGSGWGRDIPRIETTDTWASGSVDDWGAAADLGSGWGRDIPRTETTDTWASSSVDDWGAAAVLGSGWGQASDENPGWASLQFDEPKSLIYLLGPTVLPLTHSPGIVERSMRRIVSITRPPPSAAKSLPLPEGIYHPNADAVELDLDFRFTKVVLAPMIDWDGGESPVYTKPLILNTSLDLEGNGKKRAK